jgi:molybdopterin-guanine dinucleotide biosynthesis protein A
MAKAVFAALEQGGIEQVITTICDMPGLQVQFVLQLAIQFARRYRSVFHFFLTINRL